MDLFFVKLRSQPPQKLTKHEFYKLIRTFLFQLYSQAEQVLIELMKPCLEHLLVRKHSLVFGNHCGRKRAAEGVFYNLLIPAGAWEDRWMAVY